LLFSAHGRQLIQWHFDGSGDELDYLSNYTLTSHNSPGTTTIGGGAGRTLNGSTQWFSLNTSSAPLNLYNTDFTVGIIFKPAALGGNQIVFALLSGSGVPGMMIRCEGSNLVGYIGDTSGAFENFTLASGLSNGTEYTVTLAFTLSSKAWAYKVNGGLLGTQTGTHAPGNGSPQLSVGSWSGGSQFFNGSVSVPTIWYWALTSAEQDTFYNSGSPQRLVYLYDAAHNYRVFRNGRLLTSGFMPGFPTFLNNAGGHSNYLGGDWLDSAQFSGQTDDWGMWTRALSDDEAYGEYEESLAGYPFMLNWVQPKFFPPMGVTTTIIPGNASLTLTGEAPIPSLDLMPGTAMLTLTGEQPLVLYPAIPGTALLSITTFTINTFVQPDSVSLSLSMQAPEILNIVTIVVPSAGNRKLVGFPPVIMPLIPGAPVLHLVGERPLVNVSHRVFFSRQSSQYWGKLQRGLLLNVMLQLDELPEDVPTVKFWNTAEIVVHEQKMPVIDKENMIFGYRQFLDDNFEDDHYVASILFQIGTERYATMNYFQVQGGTALPANISMLEIARPLGRAVISQDAGGTISMGYKPRRKL
jgi:hypothetical protein